MKTIIAVALLALLATASAPAQEEAGIGMFYSSLSTQGEWIPVDGGSYVWRPVGVDPGWRPYTDGHWVWTDDGWYWASEEPWAWATYHYGRWYYDDYYGWVWEPGYDWAPAWVEWRYGPECIGWAPLSPYAVFSVSWGVHYRRYWATPLFYWSFVDCRYMGYNDLHRYVYRTSENSRFISRTRTGGSVRYDNGRIISRGPEREYVEQRGGARIPRASLVDVRERGQAGMVRGGANEQINVYRPRIESAPRVSAPVRPGRVRNDDHPMGLDTKGTDFRRAQESRVPQVSPVPRVDERRMDQSRPSRVVRPENPVRVPERNWAPPERRWNNPGTVRPPVRQEAPAQRERATAPQPQRERTWAPPQRTYSPPPASRPSGGETRSGRTESPRGGGGGGGTRGGGRR